MNAREFVADMAARQQDAERRQASQPTDNRWRWHYTAYLFPEALCPYCAAKARREGLPLSSAAMVSNRIWLVDNAAAKLVGQLALVEGNIVSEHPQHPHVAWQRSSCDDGYICTGNTFSISHALFSAIEPDDTLWGKGAKAIPAWLATMFDHNCPNAPDYAAGCSWEGCDLTFVGNKPYHGLDGEVLCGGHFMQRYFRCPECCDAGNTEWQRRSGGVRRNGDVWCVEHAPDKQLAEGQTNADCENSCHCSVCREAGNCICGEEPAEEIESEEDDDEDDEDMF